MLAINSDYVQSIGDPKPYLKQIADSGFTHIQWIHHWNTDFMYGPHEVAQIKRWLEEYGLALNDLHASDGQEKFWMSSTEYIYKSGLDLVKNRIDMTAELGGDVIVMHLNQEPWVPEYRTAFRDRVRRNMEVLIPYLESRGVRLALENLFPSNHATLDWVLGEYNSPAIGICYDSGHGNIVGDGLDWLDKPEVKSRLIGLHLNDNDGAGDQHKPLYMATVDWERLAEVIATSGYTKTHMTMELNIDPSGIEDEMEFLAAAKERGERFDEMVERIRAG